MDIMTVAALAMGFLTAVATKAGEDTYGKTKELAMHVYEAIRARFAREYDGGRTNQALQTFVEGDVDYAGVVEQKLLNILNADPAFAQELAGLVQSGPRQSLKAAEEARATGIRMRNTLGKGQQEVDLGARASAEDVEFTIRPENPRS
jgi:hypothetical protein